jgi:hypothetical protein
MGEPPQIESAYAAAPRSMIIQWVLPDDATGVNVFRGPAATNRSVDHRSDLAGRPTCAKLARRADMRPWFDLGILSESSP